MLLLDNTQIIVKKSPIHGRGVFTKINIDKNTPIWRFNKYIDHIITNYTDSLHYYRFNHFSYYDKLKNGYIYNTDKMKWVNHSNNPTIMTSKNNPDIMITSRDITSGEELTENYLDEYGEYDYL